MMSLLRTTFFAALLAVSLAGHHEMLGDNLEDLEHADASNSACFLLSAPPAAGKTCLMSQVVVHALASGLVPILVQVEQLQQRLAAHEAAFDAAPDWIDADLELSESDPNAVGGVVEPIGEVKLRRVVVACRDLAALRPFRVRRVRLAAVVTGP